MIAAGKGPKRRGRKPKLPSGRLLYHFTTSHHLPQIMADGWLDTTESNISPSVEHYGPDVVWLLNAPTPDGEIWVGGNYDEIRRTKWVDKSEIRFTVKVKGAVSWNRWAKKKGMDAGSRKQLADAGGDPTKWHVIQRPIPVTEWVEVTDMRTGTNILTVDPTGSMRANLAWEPATQKAADFWQRLRYSRPGLPL